jgi:hypothetical protein
VNKFCYTFVVELKARKEVKRICSLIVAVLAVTMCCGASEMSQDSAMVEMRDSLTKRPGLVKRILKYFDDTNEDKPYKKFDVSVIGGPFYMSDAKFGLGLVSAGLYRMNGCDKAMQPSNVTLFGNVSTVGFYMIGIKGNNLFPEDRYRLNYTTFFYSFP